jgi:hypothetical protein
MPTVLIDDGDAGSQDPHAANPHDAGKRFGSRSVASNDSIAQIVKHMLPSRERNDHGL